MVSGEGGLAAVAHAGRLATGGESPHKQRAQTVEMQLRALSFKGTS